MIHLPGPPEWARQNSIPIISHQRLCRFLGLSLGYWLRAQAAHDTEALSAELAEEIARIQPLMSC
jgi:hypothetical protein